jgi:hypothetical protein
MKKALNMDPARKWVKGVQRVRGILSVLAVGCFLMHCHAADADTISVTSSGVDPAAGVYNYTVTIDTNAFVTDGNGFVIYNISGFTGATLTIPGLSSYGSFSQTTSTYYNAVSSSTGPFMFGSSIGDTTPAAGNLLDQGAQTYGTAGFTNLSYSYTGSTISGTTLIGTLTMFAAPTTGFTTSPVGSYDSSGALDISNVYVPGNPTFGSTPVALPASFWGGGILMSMLFCAAMAKKFRLDHQGLN